MGAGNEFGWMAGIEHPLRRDDLSFVADFISGINSASVAVIGAQWRLSKEKGWYISLGAQLPSPDSDNDFRAVFELTKAPPSFVKEFKLWAIGRTPFAVHNSAFSVAKADLSSPSFSRKPLGLQKVVGQVPTTSCVQLFTKIV